MSQVAKAHNHATGLFDWLRKVYDAQLLTDVVLIAEGREFGAHILVLAAYSPFFRQQLTTTSSDSNRLEVHGVSSSCLGILLNFVYSGHLRLTPSNVWGINSAAQQLQLQTAVQLCQGYLTDNQQLGTKERQGLLTSDDGSLLPSNVKPDQYQQLGSLHTETARTDSALGTEVTSLTSATIQGQGILSRPSADVNPLPKKKRDSNLSPDKNKKKTKKKRKKLGLRNDSEHSPGHRLQVGPATSLSPRHRLQAGPATSLSPRVGPATSPGPRHRLQAGPATSLRPRAGPATSLSPRAGPATSLSPRAGPATSLSPRHRLPAGPRRRGCFTRHCLKTHHKQFKCQHCGRKMFSRKLLQLHRLRQHQDRHSVLTKKTSLLPCTVCSRVFLYKSSYNAHMTETHPGRTDMTETHLGCTDMTETLGQQHHSAPGRTDMTETHPGRTDMAETHPGHTDMTETHPGHTDMTETHLGRTDMTAAGQGQTDMTETHRGHTDMTETNPRQTDMTDAHPGRTDMTETHPGHTDMTETHSGCTDMTGAHPGHTDMSKAHPGRTDMTKAHPGRTDMTGAHPGHTDMTKAHSGCTDMTGAHPGCTDMTGAHPGHTDPGRRTAARLRDLICPQCDTKYKYEQSFKKHLRSHGLQEAEIDQLCQTFKLRKNPEQQVQRVDWVPCEQCPVASPSHRAAVLHMKSAHPDVCYPCRWCAYQSLFKKTLLRHVKARHSEASLTRTCDLCQKVFSKKHHLIRHKFSMHGIQDPSLMLYPCQEVNCEYVAYSQGLLTQHGVMHNANKSFKCQHCGKPFKREVSLRHHINVLHFNIRPFICEICGSSFGTEVEVSNHRGRHLREKRFKCQQCDYTAQQKANLRNHLFLKHHVVLDGKTKVLQCDKCGFQTTQRHRFNSHMEQHSQEKTVPCRFCSKLFHSRAGLRSHVDTQHRAKNFKCEFCDYSTALKKELKKHTQIVHTHPNYKPYKCCYCEFYCATSQNCRKHIKQRHSDQEVRWVRVGPTTPV